MLGLSNKRKLAYLFSVLLCWLLLSGLLEYFVLEPKGILINLGNIVIDVIAVSFLYKNYKNKSIALPIQTVIGFSLFYFFAATGDFFYTLVFYILKLDSRTAWTVVPISGSFAIAFSGAATGLYFSIRHDLKKFLLNKVNLIPLLISVPVSWAYLFKPYFLSVTSAPNALFHFIELIAILSSFLVFNFGLIIFLSSKTLFWSLLSGSLVSIVFGDWAMRAEKIAGIAPVFGIYELHWTFGISLVAGALLLFARDPGTLAPFTNRSIHSRIKLMSLILIFMTLLFVAYATGEGINVIKIVAIGNGTGAVLAAIAGFFVGDWVEEYAKELGHVAIKRITNSRSTGNSMNMPEEFESVFRDVFDRNFEIAMEDKKRREQMDLLNERGKISAQVSHDIRSPLAALEMILPLMIELSEDKRVILRNGINRIKDIANSLIERPTAFGNQMISGNLKNSTTSSLTLIAPILESIVTEKRIQYRNLLGINIDFNQSADSYGLFAKIEPIEFKRMVSNLVNNSVEALPNKAGDVKIVVCLKQSIIELTVSDNGIGIEPHLLSSLGQRGLSYKANGTGLGLHHAIETLRRYGGDLHIESHVGKGTTITCKLPSEPCAPWFVSALEVGTETEILILDDDRSTHEVWDDRLSEYQKIGRVKGLHHFSTPQEVRNYYGMNLLHIENTLFLMDFELIGCVESGLDLVEELGIQNNSILITSRYEELAIRSRCERQGIKLIPKPMIGFVPIAITEPAVS